MDEYTSHLNFNISSNEEVSVKRKKVYRNFEMPNYLRVGIMDNKKDILDVLGEVSKAAYRIYLTMKDTRDTRSNIVSVAPGSTPTEVNVQTKALRELERIGLVRRIKTTQLRSRTGLSIKVPKRTFILNPKYLFPKSNEDFDLAIFYWNQLDK